jgi:hypothetical protein
MVMLRKLIGTILAIALITNLCGCAALKRKFTRKKKHVKPAVYYDLEKYAKEPNAILYKRHYVYWKTWQEELINKLSEKNFKKNISCAQGIISNLEDMKRYLVTEKAENLQPYIDEMRALQKELSGKYIGMGRQTRLRNLLEKRYRRIKREFSYTKVKDYIVPDTIPTAESPPPEALP